MDESFVRFPADNLIEEVARLCPGFHSRQSGYVYGLEVGSGLVKVGMSRNPSRRFTAIRNDPDRPCDTLLGAAVVSTPCSNFAAIESLVHAILGPSRLKGEYFQCTLRDFEISLDCMEFEECIDPSRGPITFRDQPKRALNARIPDELLVAIQLRAVIHHKPLNEVVSELLCLGLGLDPADYGIEPFVVRSTFVEI